MADSTSAQQRLAQKALEMADEGRAQAPHHPQSDATADAGMVSTPRENYPPSGAFDAEGREPALRRSRGR